MITEQEARARVALGAAHLDVVRPGWEHRIDIGTLTLHDSCGCIVGQLCRTKFHKGLDMLHVDDAQGFGMERGIADGNTLKEIDADGRRMYQQLQDAWIEAIADRRLKAELPTGKEVLPVQETVTCAR